MVQVLTLIQYNWNFQQLTLVSTVTKSDTFLREQQSPSLMTLQGGRRLQFEQNILVGPWYSGTCILFASKSVFLLSLNLRNSLKASSWRLLINFVNQWSSRKDLYISSVRDLLMGSIYCSTNRLKKGQKRLLILYLFFIFYSIFFFLLDISF